MAEGRYIDDLSGPSKEIEELERCADPGRFFLPMIMSDTIRERADCTQDLCDDHPGSATECLAAWQTEMLGRLRVLGICDFHLTSSTPSELPQGSLEEGSVLEADGIKQYVQRSIDAEPSAPALIIVRCFIVFAPHSLLIICST